MQYFSLVKSLFSPSKASKIRVHTVNVIAKKEKDRRAGGRGRRRGEGGFEQGRRMIRWDEGRRRRKGRDGMRRGGDKGALERDATILWS